jgi:hypothetical protein
MKENTQGKNYRQVLEKIHGTHYITYHIFTLQESMKYDMATSHAAGKT